MGQPASRTVLSMATATYEEVAEAIGQRSVLVLPVGSVEQHGPHLPLNTDTITATRLAHSIGTSRPLVVAPAFEYATASQPRSGGGRQLTGSIGLPVSVVAGVLSAVISEFLRQGFPYIMVLNGHMENIPPIFEALEHNLGPGWPLGRSGARPPRRPRELVGLHHGRPPAGLCRHHRDRLGR